MLPTSGGSNKIPNIKKTISLNDLIGLYFDRAELEININNKFNKFPEAPSFPSSTTCLQLLHQEKNFKRKIIIKVEVINQRLKLVNCHIKSLIFYYRKFLQIKEVCMYFYQKKI